MKNTCAKILWDFKCINGQNIVDRTSYSHESFVIDRTILGNTNMAAREVVRTTNYAKFEVRTRKNV